MRHFKNLKILLKILLKKYIREFIGNWLKGGRANDPNIIFKI